MKPILQGLAGIRRTKVRAAWFRTITAGLKALSKNGAATAAGDIGAINLWRDDKGQYRTGFYRHWAAISEETFTSLSGVRAWLKKWLPRIQP